MQSRISPLFLGLVAVAVAGGAATVVADRTSEPVLLTVGIVLLVAGGWTVSLCLHEFAHAAVAYRGGDWSVREKGYLTLDVRRYSDVGLSVVLPLVFLLAGGIPLPGGAVWVNHGALRSRRVQSAVSFAGPATNLALALLLTAAVAAVSMPIGLAVGLSCLAMVQVLAFVLNMLPVPGLDGFGVIEPYLSPRTQQFAAKARPWAPVVLFLLLVGLPGLSSLVFRLGALVFAAIGGNPLLAQFGYNELLFWR